MPAPVEASVRSILSPYEDRLANVLLRGWQTWWDGPMRGKYMHKRTRACAVHEDILREARTEFAGERNIHIIPGPETAYMLIKDAVVARLKKGDARGLGSNNHSQASLAFITANADPFELPLGLPDVQRVDVTYLLNDLETRIDEVLVAGRDGGKRLWAYPIYPQAAMPIEVLPTQPTAPVDPADVVRIPDRRDDKKNAG